MKRHLICLTVDTDPDGLSGRTTNRKTLDWRGLEHVRCLPEQLEADRELGSIPITWFVRADGQLESILGSAGFLLEKFAPFWSSVREAQHELAWHPHLYRQSNHEEPAIIITEPNEAQEELERLWEKLRPVFPTASFRNGEGWHTPVTYATVESLGFQCDSTSIPGRRGPDGHPMNWELAPNRPYFPSGRDICTEGPERQLLELPMNTWLVRAPYDNEPKIRYINPAVHPRIFADALQRWENSRKISNGLFVWVMIFHPDEVLPTAGKDNLYSRSIECLLTNLASFQQNLRKVGIEAEWVTVAKAAEVWRQSRKRQIA